MIVWLVKVWRGVIRDYQLLHRVYREGAISDPAPGSPLEAALSVATNMTHWNLATFSFILTDRLWSVEDLVALWEAYEQRRAERAA